LVAQPTLEGLAIATLAEGPRLINSPARDGNGTADVHTAIARDNVAIIIVAIDSAPILIYATHECM
jgi:hypothetical protein